MAERYIPPYEELRADAELLLRGFVNKVRCDTCNRRITWASDTEVTDGKPIYLICNCAKDPSWYDQDLTDLTYRNIVVAWEQVFGDMFPDATKQHSYIFDRFFDKIRGQQFLAKQYKEQEAKKKAKTKG